MKPDDLLRRMEELIDRAPAVRDQPAAWQAGLQHLSRTIDAEPASQWYTSACYVVRLAFGEDSDHYRRLEHSKGAAEGLGTGFAVCVGVLKAAKEDFEAGLVHSLRELVEAEVFDDLLDQADYLLNAKYHLPACALAGAVLEDGLRKLAARHNVTWTGHSSIATVNTELYKAGIYSKPQHGQVETWGKLRNQVDHGDFGTPADIDPADVRRMIEGIRDFIVKWLA